MVVNVEFDSVRWWFLTGEWSSFLKVFCVSPERHRTKGVSI